MADDPLELKFENQDLFWIWTELNRIATALETMAPPDQAAPLATCPHPPEDRIDLGMTNGQPDWQCRRCRYRPPAT